MKGWLQRLLGGADPPEATPPPRPAAAFQPRGDLESPFAPFARALHLDIPAPYEPEALTFDPALEDAAARVLAHFRDNRPGPASAPSLSLKVLTLVAQPEPDTAELVRLISSDPALAAGLMQVAKSAHYRGVTDVETVRDAVVRLGLSEVGRVVGALAARSLFNPKLKAELTAYAGAFGALYHRAVTLANAAAFIALQQKGGRVDRAFLGGLLHDVGRSVGLRSVAAISLSGQAIDASVDAVLDRVHVEIGAECHQEWDLPQYLVEIAVRHHERAIPGGPDFLDLHAVRLASALWDLRDPASASRAAAELVQSASALGLTPPAVRAIDAELRDLEKRTAAAFALR